MWNRDALFATSPLLGLLVCVLLHILLIHVWKNTGLLCRFLWAFVLGGLLVGGISAEPFKFSSVAPANILAGELLNILTYVGLAFGYFNFVNCNVTSLRIRLLRELLEHHPQGLDQKEILNKYGADEVLSVRLNRLTKNGYLVLRGERYYIGRPGILAIARVFDVLIWIIGVARVKNKPPMV